MKSIQRWHWGKIAILWAWGGLVVALFLSAFLSQSAGANLSMSSVTFLGSVIILAALTAVTWVWLGGKEKRP